MSEKYVVIEKRVGYTPLAELDELRQRRPDLAPLSMTYAGRLDPMASGKLLVLIGDECKRRVQYDGLQKEYTFDVVCGISTDTGDCLGLPIVNQTSVVVRNEAARRACGALYGSYAVPYPNFSSKVVAGKPLFQHAIEGTLQNIAIPETIMRVYSLKCLSVRAVSLPSVVTEVLSKLEMLHLDTNTGTVAKDFRQEQIVRAWSALGENHHGVAVLSCKAIVGSGTYIRTLSSMLGKHLGVHAFALSIHRSVIGMYIPLPLIEGMWFKKYE